MTNRPHFHHNHLIDILVDTLVASKQMALFSMEIMTHLPSLSNLTKPSNTSFCLCHCQMTSRSHSHHSLLMDILVDILMDTLVDSKQMALSSMEDE